MQRTFITNLAFLLLLNVLIKPIWLLFFDVQVQEAVGEAEFGIYYAALNFTFLFNILPDLGITNFNNRNIAMHPQLLKKHFPAILSMRMVLGLVYISFMLIMGTVLGYSAYQMELLAWLAVNQFLISTILYFRSNLTSLLLFKQDSIISVLDRALMILFCALLLYGGITEGEFQVRWFVWLQTAAYGLTALIACILVLRKSGKLRFHFNWPFSLMILRKSLPFALLFVLMSLYNRTDSVMLERLLPDGADQTGLYAKAFRLLDAFNMFAMLFAVLLLPIFSRMIKEKKATGNLSALAYKLISAIAIVGSVVCFVFAEPLMELLYKTNVDQVVPIFRVLVLSFLAMSTTYIFGTLLTAGNFLKQLNIMALGGAFLNIGLNFWLIPRYGAWGAAIASVITQFLTGISQILMAWYFFNYRFNTKVVAIWMLFAALTIGAGWGVTQVQISWQLGLVGLAGAGVLIAFATGMVNLKQLFRLVKDSRAA